LWVPGTELTESNPSGAHNFGVAPTFLKDLFTFRLTNPLEGTGSQRQGFQTGTPSLLKTSAVCPITDVMPPELYVFLIPCSHITNSWPTHLVFTTDF